MAKRGVLVGREALGVPGGSPEEGTDFSVAAPHGEWEYICLRVNRPTRSVAKATPVGKNSYRRARDNWEGEKIIYMKKTLLNATSTDIAYTHSVAVCVCLCTGLLTYIFIRSRG